MKINAVLIAALLSVSSVIAAQSAHNASLLQKAHQDVGGDVLSAGATVTYDLNTVATEIQAGSYALMDTTFRPLVPEFRSASRICHEIALL